MANPVEMIAFGPIVEYPAANAMMGDDGNFYCMGHVDKDAFIDAIVSMIPDDEIRVVPSGTQVAYGYAVGPESPGLETPFTLTICHKNAERAIPISRWTRLWSN